MTCDLHIRPRQSIGRADACWPGKLGCNSLCYCRCHERPCNSLLSLRPQVCRGQQLGMSSCNVDGHCAEGIDVVDAAPATLDRLLLRWPLRSLTCNQTSTHPLTQHLLSAAGDRPGWRACGRDGDLQSGPPAASAQRLLLRGASCSSPSSVKAWTTCTSQNPSHRSIDHNPLTSTLPNSLNLASMLCYVVRASAMTSAVRVAVQGQMSSCPAALAGVLLGQPSLQRWQHSYNTGELSHHTSPIGT